MDFGKTNLETITLAAGCFWCTEAIFKQLKGVISVVSGYSGGTTKNPSYNEVCSGKTGHAEAIQIQFDSSVIPLEKILEIFWHLHDPTSLNRQGNDVGAQYRSAIFYHNSKQKEIVLASKARLEKEGIYKNPIVTKIEPFTNFYKAETHHQDYYEKNSDYPYCQFVINPKIQKLYAEFKEDIKSNA